LKVFGEAGSFASTRYNNQQPFWKTSNFHDFIPLDFPSDLVFNALSNRLHLFLGMFFLIVQGRTARRKYKQRPSSCSDLLLVLVELAVVFGVHVVHSILQTTTQGDFWTLFELKQLLSI